MSKEIYPSDSTDDEEIDEYEEYSTYMVPECYSGEESLTSVRSIRPKWKRTPRTAADFSDTKSSKSSCHDSDYDAWLENYYRELYLSQMKPSYDEKQVDTHDLNEGPKEFVTSIFTPIKKDIWSESTKYWGPDDARRHWPLSKKEGEYWFFPSTHPILNLRSRYGRFHSQLNSAAAVPEHTYKVRVCNFYKKILERLEVSDPQIVKFLNCDNFCNLKWFDSMTKGTVIRCFCRFLRTQYLMDKVYFENAQLQRIEGITFLCALSRNSGDTIKELHIWKMFAYGQCPLLLNELRPKGEELQKTNTSEYLMKIHYLQILNNFSTLTHLSINYAYLANKNGDALLCLKCIRLGRLQELRILCLRDERPLLTNPGYGVGGWTITDGVWRRAVDWCPSMRVKFVFLNMPQYENVILFLSKSIPVSYIYLSSGVDFNFEVPWDIDSTLLELRNWYASTLDTLCLHLWHHRDLLDFVIKCKILEEFPNLLKFEFIGILEDVETLDSFCCQLSKGGYKLKNLLFWVQEVYTNRKKLLKTRERVVEIRERYYRSFQILAIDADIKTLAV